MGIPKCFKHFLHCEVTLILRDFKTVTGKLVDFDYNKGKKDDGCCKQGDKKHDNEEECKFILLELTKDAESVSLLEIEEENGIVIELASVEFEIGTRICVNVCEIIYAGINAEIEEVEIELG